MINKTTITIFALGIIAALFAVHAYTVYQLRKQVIINTVNLQQNTGNIQKIVDFLNQQK